MMKLWFKYFLLGGLSCWGPELIVAAIGAAMHRLWELPNVILPLSAYVAYVLLLRSEKRLPSDPSIAGCMLIGVWVLGPTMLFLESAIKRGGFQSAGPDFLYVLLVSFVPLFVFVMATYDLSLGALLLLTVFLIFAHWRYELNHWILPLRRYTDMVLGDKS